MGNRTYLKFHIAFSLLALLAFSPASQAEDHTPDDFFTAIGLGNVAAVQLLVDKDIDPNLQDVEGNTALMLAARSGAAEIAQILLTNGARVYSRNRFGETALMLAAFNGHERIVDMLLAKGAPQGASRAGWTPLLYAAYSGHAAIIKTLIAHGADANERSGSGTTPLMLAAKRGHTDSVTTLLELGADATATNEAGDSAVSWALEAGNTDIATLLKNSVPAEKTAGPEGDAHEPVQ